MKPIVIISYDTPRGRIGVLQFPTYPVGYPGNGLRYYAGPIHRLFDTAIDTSKSNYSNDLAQTLERARVMSGLA